MSEEVLEQDEDEIPQEEITQDTSGVFYPEQVTQSAQETSITEDKAIEDLLLGKSPESNPTEDQQIEDLLLGKAPSANEDQQIEDLLLGTSTATAEEKPKETGALEAGVLHAAMGVIPMTAGLISGGLAGIAGTALELNPITGLLTGLAAGVGGAMVASKVQDSILKEILSEDTYKSLQERLMKTSEEHKIASFVGGVVPAAIGAKFSPQNVYKAAKSLAGIRELAKNVKAGDKVAQAAWNNLTNVAVQGAIGGGISTAQQAIEGDVSLGRVGADMLGWMAFSDPNKIGKFLTFHGIRENMVKDKTIAQLDAANKDADIIEESGSPLTANVIRAEGIESAKEGIKVPEVAEELKVEAPVVKENLTTEPTVAKTEMVENLAEQPKVLEEPMKEEPKQPIAESATTEIPQEPTVKESLQVEPKVPLEEPSGRQLLFSKGENKPINQVPIEDIHSSVKEISDKLPINTEVVDNESMLPENIRAKAIEKGIEGKVQGFYSPKENKIYIVADKHYDGKHAVKTLMEEAFGHAGLRRVLKPEQMNQILDSINKPEHLDEMNRIAKDYNLDMNIPEQRREAAEEFLAKLARNEIQNPTLWDKIVSYVRQFLRDLGLKMDFSDREIRNLLAKSRESMLAEKGIETQGEPRFSVREEPETKEHGGVPKLEKYLSKEIIEDLKAKGFTEYDVQPLKEAYERMGKFHEEKGYADSLAEFHAKETKLTDQERTVLGSLLLKDALNSGKIEDATQISISILKSAEKFGRGLQASNIFDWIMNPKSKYFQMITDSGMDVIKKNDKVIKDIDTGLKRMPKAVISQAKITQGKVGDAISREITKLDPKLRDAAKQLGFKIRDLIGKNAKTIDDIGEIVGKTINDDMPLLSKEDIAPMVEFAKNAFKGMVKKAQVQELNRLAAGNNRVAKAMKENSEKIIELSNMGGLNKENVYNAVKEKLGLPEFSKEKADILDKMAQDVQKEPEESIQRSDAIGKMMAYVNEKSGLDKLKDIASGVWYANILSGYITHAKNFISTGINTSADIAASLIAKPSTTLTKGVLGEVYKGIVEGWGKGMTRAAHIMKTGYEFERFSKYGEAYTKMEVYPSKWLLFHKVIGRAMRAADELFYNTGYEARAKILASDIAVKEGLSGNALSKRVAEILENTPELRAKAFEQAKAEGLTGRIAKLRELELIEQWRPSDIRLDSRDFASHATFNYKPEGSIGFVVNVVERLLGGIPIIRYAAIPFTRIVGNTFDVKLNWTPVGYLRGFVGKGNFITKGGSTSVPAPTGRAYAEQMVKASLGTLAISGIYALAKSGAIEITGNGPDDYNHKTQLFNSGWNDHSISIFGSPFMSYKDWPLGAGFAMIGALMDATKYNKISDKDAITRLAWAAWSVQDVVTSQSFLSGAMNLAGALSGGRTDPVKAIGRLASNMTTSLVVPNLAKQIDQSFTGDVFEARSIGQNFLKQIPFARNIALNKMINRLGQEVDRRPWHMFVKTKPHDPVWDMLYEKEAYLSTPRRNMKLGDRFVNEQEYHDFIKISGSEIYEELNSRLDELMEMSQEDCQEEIDKIVKAANKNAKAVLRENMVSE